MHKLSLNSEISVFTDFNQLEPIQQLLLQKAKEAATNAYAPYSNFKVGAAVLLADEAGTIVLGSNQENAAYPVTICAERVAIYSALTQYPNAVISRIAITIISSNQNVVRPVSPCGSCRQVIYETELRCKRDIELIMQGDSGEIYVLPTVKNILPLMFDASFL
jgi:cytidine deaminase